MLEVIIVLLVGTAAYLIGWGMGAENHRKCERCGSDRHRETICPFVEETWEMDPNK